MPVLKTSMLDNLVAVGLETTYGTASTDIDRGVTSRTDGWTPNVQELATEGVRADRQTLAANQVLYVPSGGVGQVETPWNHSGMLRLCRHMLDAFPASATNVSTGVDSFAFTTNVLGPDPATANSLSFIVGRVGVDGTRWDTAYLGCVPTEWTLSTTAGDPLMLAMTLDYQSDVAPVASSASSYVAPVLTYSDLPYFPWSSCAVTLGGTALEMLSFSFTASRGLNVDRRYLSGNAGKAQPIRGAVPVYSGTIEAHLNAATAALVAAWKSNTVSASLVFTATVGTNIVRLTLPSVQFTGSEPQFALEDHSTVSLPFMVRNAATSATLYVQGPDDDYS